MHCDANTLTGSTHARTLWWLPADHHPALVCAAKCGVCGAQNSPGTESAPEGGIERGDKGEQFAAYAAGVLPAVAAVASVRCDHHTCRFRRRPHHVYKAPEAALKVPVVTGSGSRH